MYKRKPKKDNSHDLTPNLRGVDPSQVKGDRISLQEFRDLQKNGSKQKGPKSLRASINDKKDGPLAEKKSKYNAKKMVVDGITFDSILEGKRYIVLKQKLKNGDIEDLVLQKEFIIEINDIKVCSYFADFCYTNLKTGDYVVEDAKGKRHPMYMLKKKMMFAALGIKIFETNKDTVTQ
jgi:hypothetical protein